MVVPSISYALPTFINKIPCDWDIYNSSTFQAKFDVNTPQQVNDKVVDLVYDEKYWFAINIKPNATETLFESLINDTAPLFNSTLFNQVVYETGRDPTNLKSTILPVAQTIEEYYHTFYTLNYLPALLTNITQVYRYALTDNARHIAAAGKYNYEYYDHRPFTDRILLAPHTNRCCLLFTANFFPISIVRPITRRNGKSAKTSQRFNLPYRYVMVHLFLCVFVLLHNNRHLSSRFYQVLW